MEYYICKSNDALCHWGIPGMKWGIRRYQNKDGSLTKAGRKRYAKLEAEMKALKPKKVSKSEKAAETEKAARKKVVSEMTDDELRERTNRMRIEKEYYDAAKNLALANPVQVSAGKKFMKSLVNDVVAPAAKNAGKEWAENFMKDQLGLNKKDLDPLKKLENEYKKLEWEQKIDRIKKKDPDDDLSWDERQKKQTWLKGRVEELENEKKVKYYEKHGKPMKDKDSSNSSNNSGNNNNSGNKSNDNSDNNSNKQNNPNNNSNNKTASQPSKPTQNTSKENQQKTVSNKTKANDLDYYSEEYEKEVDKLLAEIDNEGWELYKKYYR